MKLSFNVIIYKPNPDLRMFKTNPREFHPSLGFKGYVSVSDMKTENVYSCFSIFWFILFKVLIQILFQEMFRAPAPVMAYLCELYRLHEAPVFGNGAKTQVFKIASKFY